MVHDGDLNICLIKFFNILGFKTFLNNGKIFINIKKISLHKCCEKKSLKPSTKNIKLMVKDQIYLHLCQEQDKDAYNQYNYFKLFQK